MSKLNVAVYGLLAAVLTLVGCTKSEAAPLDIGLSYVDNEVIDKQGAKLSVGSEYKNIKYGATALASDKRLETYGVYLGVQIRIQGTQLTVTPTITTDYYDDAEEFVGGVGMNVAYQINKSLFLEAQGTTNRSFDSSSYTGEVYSVGLVKRF